MYCLRIAVLALGLVLIAAPSRSDELESGVDIEQLVREAGLVAGQIAMRDHPRWRPPEKVVVRLLPGFGADFEADVPGAEIVRVTSLAEAREHAPTADAIIGFCTDDLVSVAERAAWIQIFSAGAERCLAAEPVSCGDIVLTNMQKMSSPVIAEHAIAMTAISC